ncbi:MAG: phenylalanine--tRNA ligase subunit beta, partial [Planctomycetota bacterium]
RARVADLGVGDGAEGDDAVIDLEVTSNRGDCLGHLGVAREVAVLYGLQVCEPELEPISGSTPVDQLIQVTNQFPEACPRYTARVVRGVKVGPSPKWMVDLLAAVGINSVNNVVDATNFVMLECGQPLHAFDLAKVSGGKIVVRPGRPDETLQAIDHRDYAVDASTCVIADQESPLAVGGVMGGASSEVTDQTTDLIIEAAVFVPLSVRRTARRLKLHSPSSFRFERRVDPVRVDWASRRACQLIVEMAGGEIADGVIDTAPEIGPREPITLRYGQVRRILGMDIPPAECTRILEQLGCVSGASTATHLECLPPSWRHDLTREADLIEEIARIHGYDQIPEDAPIAVTPSARRPFDVAMEKTREVMIAAGISEAMTPSVVTQRSDALLSPWTDLPALATQTPMLEGARTLRRTLIPSLLQSRANNWAAASLEADLFEIAHVYLPQPVAGDDADSPLPEETYCLGIVRGGDFFELKGIVETLCRRLGVATPISVKPNDRDGLISGATVQLCLGDVVLGYLGIINRDAQQSLKLNGSVNVAELALPVLLEHAHLVPQQQAVSAFPSISRDLNFVLSDAVTWNQLAATVQQAGGTELAAVRYQETYRDANKDGEGRKRVLLTVDLQSHTETLSGDQADDRIQAIVASCESSLQAQLLGQ